MVIAVKNPQFNEDRTFLGSFVDYTGTAVGQLRSWSLVRSVSRLFNALSPTSSSGATAAIGVADTAISAIGVVLVPARTKDAYQSIVKIGDADGVPLQRKIDLAMRDTMEAASSWMGAAAWITRNPALESATSITNLTQDAADLKVAAENYRAASSFESLASGDVLEALEHTRKYHLLRIIKATLSVAAAIFALIMLLTGVQILPLVLAILLSLTTTIVAIRRDIFKNEGRFQLIDLNRPALA